MRQLFADTGYWVALIDEDDNLHLKAVSVSRTLGAVMLVTHELVLVEVLNHFCAYGPTYRRKALENVERIRQNSQISVIAMDSERFAQAMTRYSRYYDKNGA